MATKSYIFLLFCLVLGLFFFFLTNSNLGCSSVLEESESLSIRDGATTSTTNTGTPGAPGDTTSPTTAPGTSDDTTSTTTTTTTTTTAGEVAAPDTTSPTVSNVTSTKADGTYGIGTLIPITITFSEPVIVTGTPYVELETGATDRHAIYASGTGTATLTFNYTVQSTDTTADLNYTGADALTLNGGTIKDAAGNNATLTLSAPGAAHSLGTNKALVIDGVAPTISLSTLATDNAYVEITFSENVFGSLSLDPLVPADFDLTFNQNDGRATVASIASISIDGNAVTINLDITGTPNGDETITITPADDSSIYDAYGNPIAAGQTTGAINLHQVLWSIQTIAGTPQLNAVALSGDTGYAVGNGGTILSLTDGTWASIVDPPTDENLNGVDFYTANYAWIAGANGTILDNSSGTFSQTLVNPITSESFSDIASGPNSLGSLVGLTGIIYSNGGGGMFNHANAITESSETPLNGIDFYNLDFGLFEATIWAVGNLGTLTYFDLDDNQWKLSDQSGIVTTRNLADVDFFDATHGWAVGDNGTILFYNGETWATRESNTLENLKDVCFVTGNDGWAVGENGTIIYTSDGGTTWTRQVSGTTQHLYGIDYTVATVVTIVGAGGTILQYVGP